VIENESLNSLAPPGMKRSTAKERVRFPPRPPSLQLLRITDTIKSLRKLEEEEEEEEEESKTSFPASLT